MVGRDIYVPTPATRAERKKAAQRRRLDHGEPTARAGRVFRGFAWSGEPPAVVAAPPRLGQLATMSVREAMANTAWTGEAPTPPTEEQAARTVRAVLQAFGFDNEE